jgi:ferrochelatase
MLFNCLFASYTREQCHLVQQELESRGMKAKCYFAMRYWDPMTDEVRGRRNLNSILFNYAEQVMQQIENDGVDTLVIVPLYPHFSLSTSGSSLKLLYKYFKRLEGINIIFFYSDISSANPRFGVVAKFIILSSRVGLRGMGICKR